MNIITIEKLSDKNVDHYKQLTRTGDDGKLCYCSFWHQKWSSMEDYYKVKEENPERLKNCVLERMNAQFHVGVIAYLDKEPCAWISVGPLIDFFWTWRRVVQVGDSAKNVAGIMCFAIAPKFRGQGLQIRLLEELKKYGKNLGWSSIESYPFSDEAIQKHGVALKWPGIVKGYEGAGFQKLQDHWLSAQDTQRYIYNIDL